MRVAVIGAGHMGGMHAVLLSAMDEVDELLVVDADQTRAEEVARGAGGRAVACEEALGVAEAVIVATPPQLHRTTVEAALDAGLPVLCEKPLAADLAEAVALAARGEESGAHLEVGFQRRHDPGFAAARRAVADGTAGRLQLIHLSAFDPLVQLRTTADWPDGDAAPLFLDSSVHDFDFVRWMSGQEIAEVTVDGSGRDDRRPSDPRGIETAVVTMRLSGGALAVLEASWLHPSGYDIRAEILAEGIHLTMGLSPRTPARHLDWILPEDSDAPAAWAGYLERFEPAYRAELEAFLAAVRGERPPSTTPRDGLEAIRIAVAATRSYRERRTVALAEIR